MSAVPAVLARLADIIGRIAGPSRTPPSLGAATRLSTDLWLDSVEMLEVVLACEREFGIAFEESTDLTPQALETLGSLSDVVQARLEATKRL
jgi:acyl carrier protein